MNSELDSGLALLRSLGELDKALGVGDSGDDTALNMINPCVSWSVGKLPATLEKLKGYSCEEAAVVSAARPHFAMRKVSIAVTNADSQGKPRQTRQRLSDRAKYLLESAFDRKSAPNKKERELLAEKCGITPLQVRVWFTNQRMRKKKNW
ncbi:uncharacterized protein LODBEIA_P56880 [Lodderomyces beijingensis]|uniref:Homeobox domain-containing protein n=1 Tax=Lodderomyces beijingensis TaxID=1775926 RepID=A0ABP0ZVM4_9ASCO